MDTNSEVDALREDLGQLRDDFASLAENVKQLAGDYVGAGASKARDGLQSASCGIESRPFISILSAFGVGLILGKLISH